MSKKEIFKYLIESNSSISVWQVVVAMMVALGLALFMYFVYRSTYTGVVYSKGFNQTLVLIALIVTMVMTIIGGNLALSLGMVGSLSIIRFRTAVKEPRDMAFVFWAIAIGLSCGAEMYVVAVIGSVVIAVVLFFFRFDIYDANTYLIVIKGKSFNGQEVEKILNCNTKRWKLRMQNTAAGYIEVTYETNFKKQGVRELVDKIRDIDGVESVNVVTYAGEVLG
ncbi:MAG: DUF4956 domain-containing protein [Lachnospiraceae bacterium]|nr:DUF4956 domain-containing protein [Lachnospiraceae bacterium]